MDLLRRSMTGNIVYAVLFPAVFWPFDFHKSEPQLSLVFAASMLIISLFRLVHWYNTERLYQYSPQLWRSFFTLFSLSHASILSLFFALAMYDPRFEPILNVTMLAIGGIASSAIVALMPRITLALVNLAILLVPSIIAGFYLDDKTAYAVMILVYVSFIALMGLRSSKEYQRSFQIETQLDEQRKVLEQLNKVDALTEIYNRGYFNIEFANQWQNGIRHNISTALLLIDIDHFKKFNDKHGHLCGDACLVHVANLISEKIKRTTDMVARYGGEEFVVLLTECNEEDAAKLAEKIRHAIESKPFEFDGRSLSVTACIGVAAMMPNVDQEKELLIEAADKAMYVAKKAGRNKVISAATPVNQ
ncbi:GGDEF domain-containing protein [Glaciecola sp. MF2-115]|uniref:GGDEF domain-containing protein n=1 Tax=Glaciecola sp. MF2-115 TaxID=3384827 RepID=UPI0039A189ED